MNRRHLSGILLAVVASLFLAVMAAAQVGGPDPAAALANNPGRLAAVQPLLDRLAAGGGDLPLIVELNTAFRPEGSLAGAQAVEEQRAAIARAQSAVIADLQGQGVENVKGFRTIPFMAMRVDHGALQGLISSPWVKNIEEDKPDRLFLDQSVPRIGADQAWSAGYTGNGVAVAVLDSGVDSTHPFLSGKVVAEACYSDFWGDADAQSLCPGGVNSDTSGGDNCVGVSGCDHGTHVAGIATGYNTNPQAGEPLFGVARGADVIAVQVFTRYNTDAWCGLGNAPCLLSWASDQVLALERVYALRGTYDIASVNMSLGGGQYFLQATCDTNNASRKAIIDNLRTAGIATVIASGNDGFISSMAAPGCISTAVSVGSTDDSDLVASYSNSVSFLDLLAPGSAINSSVPGATYDSWQGTSMATPHVAGCWALIRDAAPGATVDQVLTALKDTGTSIIDSRNLIAKPRINCFAALQQVAGAPVTVKFPWAMYMPAFTGGGGAPTPTAAYWGIDNDVCCTTSSATFYFSADGTMRRSALASCSASSTWEGWASTTPGAKNFYLEWLSSGCGSFQTTYPYTLQQGLYHLFVLGWNGSNFTMTVYTSTTGRDGLPPTAGRAEIMSEGSGDIWQRTDEIILDLPAGEMPKGILQATN